MNTSVDSRTKVYLSAGRRHGPVTRVFSPGDVGQMIKPFIFLDRFDIEGNGKPLFAMHPHSGIATMTVLTSGRMRYEDTTGKSGVLEPGSVEWMRAGAGVWHDGWPEPGERVQGWQLWFALPAELESTPAESQYLPPTAVRAIGPARVILGALGGVTSEIRAPQGIDVLHVRLSPGQRWSHVPRPEQEVAWAHVSHGEVRIDDVTVGEELAVFDAAVAKRPLQFEASSGKAAEFILGLAPRHPFDLVMGRYSVHTTPDALELGQHEIARIGEHLRSQRRIA